MYVLDVESGELIEGPIDPPLLPIAWLLDGASYGTSGACHLSRSRRTKSSSTDACGPQGRR